MISIKSLFFIFCSGILISCTFFHEADAQNDFILKVDNYKPYIDQFNKNDEEIYKRYYPNDAAWSFLKDNIPLLDCPDKKLETTYYFRWWTLRKHIVNTPDGFIFSEFLPDVPWAGKNNSINCPAAHHFYEARWLKDTRYLNDYAMFWLRKCGSVRSYSFWIADALWAYHKVHPQKTLLSDVLPDLVTNYQAWEKGWMYQGKFFVGKNKDGLFSQVDDRDGMEMSISGNGKRVTINSYMFGDASAISLMAQLEGKKDLQSIFKLKADSIRQVAINKLWDPKALFFKTLTSDKNELVDVRELSGFTPWYFNLPPNGKGFEQAWNLINSTKGFNAPYGLTSAEQSHPKFQISYAGHECKWDGPSWPFATSITLTAMANVLNNYEQSIVTKADYFKQLLVYTNAQQRINENGNILPWIDEVINPYTGDWISRSMLKSRSWDTKTGGYERGKDYNHSTFCDLVISGLIGLRPQSDNTVVVAPLIPDNTWDWFCLDRIPYHGRILTIVYDRFGTKYNRGVGLMCFVDGELKVTSKDLKKVTFKM